MSYGSDSPPAEPTSVGMNGRHDSTAVFPVGKQVLHQRGSSAHLRHIPIRYPLGLFPHLQLSR